MEYPDYDNLPFAYEANCNLVEQHGDPPCGAPATHAYCYGYLCYGHAPIALIAGKEFKLQLLPIKPKQAQAPTLRREI